MKHYSVFSLVAGCLLLDRGSAASPTFARPKSNILA
jgi:hypothetical protein